MIRQLKAFFRNRFHKGHLQQRGESIRWDSLYRKINYTFHDETLLERALTHRSAIQNGITNTNSNERLEFLGDSVLGLIVTDELFHSFPDKTEGELTRVKSHIVSREILAHEAKRIGLGKYLILGCGEERSGGRDRHSILSNTFEALLGALYLDGGIDHARMFIKRFLVKDLNRFFKRKFHANYKSWLLEHVQGEGKKNPMYRVLKESGPDHKKIFTVEVSVLGEILGRGQGLSKKKAEQAAAYEAVKKLGLL